MKIQTEVKASVQDVWDNFGIALFQTLNPPFPKARVLEFGGNEKGKLVSLELDFILFKQKWVSEITESGELDKGFYFIDKGIELPFFLSHWEHRHLILGDEAGNTKIIDDVSFRSKGKLLTWLFAPLIWMQFVYRKPRYKKFFEGKTKVISFR